MTNAYSTGGVTLAVPYDRRYIIGPTAEIHLPLHLSFEVDALYRRNGFDYTFRSFGGIVPGSTVRATIDDWQIPFLAKYEMGFGPLRPFVDAGVVYRHVTNVKYDFISTNPNTTGFTVGGGVTLKLLMIRLSPEIRYSHWPTRPILDHVSGLVVSASNQADFLLGLTF